MSIPNRPMTRNERSEAQRRVEVDETLLRGVRGEATRLRAKRHLIEGEISGARQAISEKEHQITICNERISELDGRIERLVAQEAALREDQSGWSERLAG
mgnify:CR=1 FL=1